MANVDPVRAEDRAGVEEQRRPDQRTGGRVGDEPSERHPGHARREADERSDDGQKSPDEDGRAAVLGEEALGEIDLVRPDQQVPAVSFEDGSAAVRPDRVRDERAERIADRRRHDHDPEPPGSVGQRLELGRIRDQEPGVRQDQLGGERDHGGLDRHRHHHPEVADRPVQAVQERDHDLVDEREHSGLMWRKGGRRAA